MEDLEADEGSTAESSGQGGGHLARRRFVVALGFGIANAALLKRLPDRRRTPEVRQSALPAAAPTTSPPPVKVPPALDATGVDGDDHLYDTVIAGGRVIDPDTGFDSLAHIGVDGDSVARVSLEPLTGRATLDATGLVVAPGFIDILSYRPNGYGDWYKIADGVTTNLCLHGLDDPVAEFLAETGPLQPPVNYGGAVDHYEHRKDIGVGIQRTDADQRAKLLRLAEADLEAGAIGIHQQPEYTVDLETSEIVAHGELAARYTVPLCLHVRYSEDHPPGTQREALDEAIEVARRTGCAIHLEHLNSTGGTGRMRGAIDQLETARGEGLTVTACVYPYTSWATYAASARFNNFQEKYGISYGDLQVAGTSERLTEAGFRAARDDNRLTAAFAMSEEDVTDALAAPWVMIGSDSILESHHNNHPRSAGCFSRVLGRYVRERGVLSLQDALARMTILPARLLETASPAMARRGRLRVGSVADVTMFDPDRIIDRATVADPGQESDGVVHVMVGGRLVRSGGVTDRTVRPGVPILRGES
jgi:dihydroorotase